MYQVRFACTQCGAIMKIRSKQRIKPGTAVKCVKCATAVPVPITTATGVFPEETASATSRQTSPADSGSVRFQRGPQGKRTRATTSSAAVVDDEPFDDVEELPEAGFSATERYLRTKGGPLWRKALVPVTCAIVLLLILAGVVDRLTNGEHEAVKNVALLPIALAVLAIFLGIYLAPSLVAHFRKHRNFTPILILNIFFGWTIAFWILCLAWAFSSDTQNERIIVIRE